MTGGSLAGGSDNLLWVSDTGAAKLLHDAGHRLVLSSPSERVVQGVPLMNRPINCQPGSTSGPATAAASS